PAAPATARAAWAVALRSAASCRAGPGRTWRHAPRACPPAPGPGIRGPGLPRQRSRGHAPAGPAGRPPASGPARPAAPLGGLAVKCQDVVSIEIESGDGYSATDTLVRAMPVVMV